MLIKLAIISLLGFYPIVEEDIPFLDQDKYSYEIIYSFKKRPAPDPNTYNVGGGGSVYDASPLPYIEVKVTCLFDKNKPYKYQLLNNARGTLKQKKYKEEKEIIEIDMGYTSDIKDRVGPYQFSIVFLNQDKKPTSKIVFEFTKDGDMLVNGEIRGKI